MSLINTIADNLGGIMAGAGLTGAGVGAWYRFIRRPQAQLRQAQEDKRASDQLRELQALRDRLDRIDAERGAENLRKTNDVKATVLP